MTEPPVEDLMKLAQWAVRSWKKSPEYQDILSEAYLEAWKGYQAAVAKGYDKPLATAARRAMWAPREWLSRWHGRQRDDCARHRFQHLPLEAIADVAISGFEDRLLTHLEMRDTLQQIWATCNEPQRQVIHRLFWLQETKQECAAALGMTEHRVKGYYQRAVEACRKQREATG